MILYDAQVESELQQKLEVIKSLQTEVERLQCGLLCEKEQNTTLGIEQSSAKVELQKAKSENARLLDELNRLVKDSQAKVMNGVSYRSRNKKTDPPGGVRRGGGQEFVGTGCKATVRGGLEGSPT